MASKSKKLIALLLTAMMASTALVGCGDDSDDDSPAGNNPVVVSTDNPDPSPDSDLIDINNEETINEIKEQLAKEAAEKGKTITIKLWCASDDMAFEKSRIEEFKTKFADSKNRYEFKITVVANGEDEAGGKVIDGPQKAADVFNFADDQLSSLKLNGALSAVAEYYSANVTEENTEDSVKISSVGGELYAFPKTSDNGYFLYYDKRILTEEDVKTFDTMIEKSEKAGKQVYFNITNAWYNASFFFTAGVKIEYKNGKQTATFDSAEGLSAAKAMCHLAKNDGKGFMGTSGGLADNAAVSQYFTENKLSAAIIGTWMGPAIKKAIGEENVGAAKLPTVLMDNQQKQLHSFGGYKLIGVNVYAKYPFASQTLAYFLGHESSQLERYKTRGLIPTNKNANEDDRIKNDPATKAIADQREFAHGQGSSVGGGYWNCGIAGLGSTIVTDKGGTSESKLKETLAGCQHNAETT